MKFKKNITLISIFICTFLTSCFYDSDNEFALSKTKTLIDCLENEKKDEIKNLFAPNIIKRVKNIDDQIDALFEYWKGEDASIVGSGGLGGLSNYNYGEYVFEIDFLYYVKTSECNYSISIMWYRRDDIDKNNEGMWYLWLDSYINKEDEKYKGSWENYEVGITLM